MGLKHQREREASMSQNIVYVGIDVDDVRYHGCALKAAHRRATHGYLQRVVRIQR